MPHILTEEEWATLKTYVKILEPFKTATVMLNADSYPTLSQYYPIVTILRDMCCESAASDEQKEVDLAQNLYQGVIERFHIVNMENEHLLFAMLLDPRYKNKLLSPTQKVTAESSLRLKVFETQKNKVFRERNLDEEPPGMILLYF